MGFCEHVRGALWRLYFRNGAPVSTPCIFLVYLVRCYFCVIEITFSKLVLPSQRGGHSGGTQQGFLAHIFQTWSSCHDAMHNLACRVRCYCCDQEHFSQNRAPVKTRCPFLGHPTQGIEKRCFLGLQVALQALEGGLAIWG